MKRVLISIFCLLVTLAVVLIPTAVAFAQVATSPPGLPEPPPRGTFQGPPSAKDTTAYPGGILIVKSEVLPWEQSLPPELLFELHCNNNSFEKTLGGEAETGLSIQGPISTEQTQSIIEAVKELKKGGYATVKYVMQGRAGWTREWTLTGMNRQTTRYKILAIRETAPARNELIGFLDVDEPVTPKVDMTEKPHAIAGKPGYKMPSIWSTLTFKYIQDPDSPKLEFPPKEWNDMLKSPQGRWDSFKEHIAPPQKGGTFLLDFGQVRVFSGQNLFGASFLGLGETATFKLPPGNYEVKAPVKVMGIPFNLSVGGVASDTPVQLNVTIQGVETIWYGMLGLGALIGLGLISWGVSFCVQTVRKGKGQGPPSESPPSKPAAAPKIKPPTIGPLGGPTAGAGKGPAAPPGKQM